MSEVFYDAEILSVFFDPRWKVLYLQGSFFTPEGAEWVKVRVGGFAAEAHTGLRRLDARYPGLKYCGWTFEGPIGLDLKAGDEIEVIGRDRAGREVTVRHRYGDPLKPRQKPFTVDAPKWMGAHGATPPPPVEKRENVIFVCVHNLDVEDRVAKLRCFEAIDRELRRNGWRFVVVHHSIFHLETTLETIHFLDETPLPVEGDWALASPRAREALFEATELMNGFHGALGRKSTWEGDRAQVWNEALLMEALIRKRKPYLCLLWHEWNSFAHMNRFICEYYGIPVMYSHEGFLADTLGLDPYGEMAESLPARDAAAFRELPVNARDMAIADRYIAYVRDNNLDRKVQCGPGSVANLLAPLRERGEKVLFYAGVNDWQTGMLPFWWGLANLHSPVYLDTRDALRHLVGICEERGWNLLFKPHPNVGFNRKDLDSERLIILKSANIIECLRETDACATLMSTVQYGALVHDRPVVSLARSSLFGHGCALEPSHPSDVEGALEAALAREGQAGRLEAFRGHVARLIRYYLYPYSERAAEVMGKGFADCARYVIKSTGPGRFA